MRIVRIIFSAAVVAGASAGLVTAPAAPAADAAAAVTAAAVNATAVTAAVVAPEQATEVKVAGELAATHCSG